jgi:hypothetical protein
MVDEALLQSVHTNIELLESLIGNIRIINRDLVNILKIGVDEDGTRTTGKLYNFEDIWGT